MKHKQSMILLLAAAISLSACGARDSGSSQPAASNNGSTVYEPIDQAAGAADQPIDAKPLPSVTLLYYVSDGEMGELIEQQIEVKDDGSSLHKRAFDLLTGDPGDGKVTLWKGASFNRVELSGGILTVDVSIPDSARLGAPGEALALEALLRTAFQFEEVDAVNILVEGEETDSLMGHEYLEHPIHRS
jgi:spore germination protein GerM